MGMDSGWNRLSDQADQKRSEEPESHRQPELLRLDAGMMSANRMEGWIAAACYAAILVVLLWLTIRFDWPEWIVIGLAALAAISVPIELLLIPKLRYESWRYGIREHEIELRNGFVFRKQTLIPIVRIQHIDTKQGPLEKKYGIATLTVATAAGSHSIPGLTENIAEELRGRLAALTRMADDEI